LAFIVYGDYFVTATKHCNTSSRRQEPKGKWES
jgi:hypothetical protein